jgi:L-ribulose-5-phosphate 4-epimerase
MLLKSLREEVLEANLELVRRGLVLYTFGNASGISRQEGLVAIKPSGVPYDKLTPEQIVITNLDGKIVEGKLRPSSDLATHIELYRQFPAIGGVAHTHSEFATAWAQARRPIPCFGTTHADYFHGPVPVTAALTADEISNGYEKNTGTAICRILKNDTVMDVPAALVAGHAPFCWGVNAAEAAHNSAILEYVAKMACYTLGVRPDTQPIESELLEKHHRRKHGPGAYYGQDGKGPVR